MADLDQPLRLHPLTYLDEGDEVTVGRADINSFGLFPADGAALLRRLEEGSPVPPIDVYQVGDVYFVKHGHHRVSVARRLGWERIRAHVVEVTTRAPVGSEMTAVLGQLDDQLLPNLLCQLLLLLQR